jgi:hypothetical protein
MKIYCGRASQKFQFSDEMDEFGIPIIDDMPDDVEIASNGWYFHSLNDALNAAKTLSNGVSVKGYSLFDEGGEQVVGIAGFRYIGHKARVPYETVTVFWNLNVDIINSDCSISPDYMVIGIEEDLE